MISYVILIIHAQFDYTAKLGRSQKVTKRKGKGKTQPPHRKIAIAVSLF